VVEQLQLANVLQMTETAGVMSAVFDLTLDYLGNRFAFGRPLHSYQALKHRVADMKMWLEASLGLAWTAAVAFSRNQADAASLVSAAKSYVGERSTDLIQDCIQLHGGIGVTWEHDLHLYLRRATGNRLLFGTPEDHRERLAEIAGL
jgi:alkylation response protein AidB-like acyl-CoA dehydrogenase